MYPDSTEARMNLEVTYDVKETKPISGVIATLQCNSMIPDNPTVDFKVFSITSDQSQPSEYFWYSKFEVDGKQRMNLTIRNKLSFQDKEVHRIYISCRVS